MKIGSYLIQINDFLPNLLMLVGAISIVLVSAGLIKAVKFGHGRWRIAFQRDIVWETNVGIRICIGFNILVVAIVFVLLFDLLISLNVSNGLKLPVPIYGPPSE